MVYLYSQFELQIMKYLSYQPNYVPRYTERDLLPQQTDIKDTGWDVHYVSEVLISLFLISLLSSINPG